MYPESAPVYIITVTLTQKVMVSVGRYSVPLTVSTMTVQSLNGSEIQPFIVSCQTHCGDEIRTPVCQTASATTAGKLDNSVANLINVPLQ